MMLRAKQTIQGLLAMAAGGALTALFGSAAPSGPATGAHGLAVALPVHLPEASPEGVIVLPAADGQNLPTTLVPALQKQLETTLIDARSPIAAVVVADARTGAILAMAQGRDPGLWGGKTHTALHTGFPAASLFKTVATTAAFEVSDLDVSEAFGLDGGCEQVRDSGVWLFERPVDRLHGMSLKRAYGSSCNGFFAKIAVNQLGMGVLTEFARRYGWESGFGTDFQVERSPFHPPTPQTSSTSTIGRFAAGFGNVGMSAVHAASMMLTIANDGRQLPLKLKAATPDPDPEAMPRAFSAATAGKLRQVMADTVQRGTASFAFSRGRYRPLRTMAGGKTGTLTGSSPKGLTTWFAGLSPVDRPEVVVAAVVMLEDRWFIKAPNLAAEAFRAYYDLRRETERPISRLP